MTQQMVSLTGETATTNAKMVTLNEENERQGKTLMVFTIVTIIFVSTSHHSMGQARC
jgi:hypothetical protein